MKKFCWHDWKWISETEEARYLNYKYLYCLPSLPLFAPVSDRVCLKCGKIERGRSAWIIKTCKKNVVKYDAHIRRSNERDLIAATILMSQKDK